MREGIILEFNNDAGSAVLLSVSPEPPSRSYNLGEQRTQRTHIFATHALSLTTQKDREISKSVSGTRCAQVAHLQ